MQASRQLFNLARDLLSKNPDSRPNATVAESVLVSLFPIPEQEGASETRGGSAPRCADYDACFNVKVLQV